MYKIEDFDVKSELLRKHWKFINVTYGSLVKIVKENESKTDTDTDISFRFEMTLFDQFYDIIYDQFREIYQKFVLHPIRDEVLTIFHKAQTSDLKLKTPSNNNTKVYSVYYYLYQYFSVQIEAYHECEEYVHFELDDADDLNLLLYELFETIWHELNLGTKTEEELFDDKSEFYDLEVKFLSEFLSKCWNETKAKTKINAIGILTEATSIGTTYSLDENKEIEVLH